MKPNQSHSISSIASKKKKILNCKPMHAIAQSISKILYLIIQATWEEIQSSYESSSNVTLLFLQYTPIKTFKRS